MATILTDISALQFHRTPPAALLMDPHPGDHPANAACPFTMDARRRNAPECYKRINAEIDGVLAGITPPFHILDTDMVRNRAPHLILHSWDPPQSRELIHLSEGLFVTSPEQTLFDLSRTHKPVAVAKLMYEFCGLYTLAPLIQTLQTSTSAQNNMRPHASTNLGAFYQANGTPRSFLSCDNSPLAWEPCIQRNGNTSSLWKRPPLCTVDGLASFATAHESERGIGTFKQALRYVVPGSGSPAETIAALLLGPERWLGQEGFSNFLLNRRVALSGPARESLGQDVCVVDITWCDGPKVRRGCCIEIDGSAFHDDSLIDPHKLRSVNEDSARRAALAHMGLEVVTLSWSQLVDINRWDTAMDLVYRKLNLYRRPPTCAFLKRRERFRREVFAPGIA